MECTKRSAEVKIGLIDGPVVTKHPDLTVEYLRGLPKNKRVHMLSGK
jgi:hypothetical protein